MGYSPLSSHARFPLVTLHGSAQPIGIAEKTRDTVPWEKLLSARWIDELMGKDHSGDVRYHTKEKELHHNISFIRARDCIMYSFPLCGIFISVIILTLLKCNKRLHR